jgi:glycosyl transferase family 87
VSALTWRDRINFVCGAIVLMAALLGIVSFATTHQGSTTFGRPLGEDFAQFYEAATVLNQHQPRLLYDQNAEDAAYHKRFPRMGPSASNPYPYPPFVAEAFRPIANLPYAWAVGVWLLIALGLYIVGFRLLWAVIGGAERVVLLLCLAFEPVLFESVLGGQLSAIAFASVAGYLYLDQRDRQIAGGAVLGLCLYKPTLVVFFLPVLVLTRRWRAFAGFVLSGVILGGASVALAGVSANRAFLSTLVSKVRLANGAGSLVVNRWKFVDLNDFLHLLFGNSVIITAVVPLAMLAVLVLLYRSRPRDDEPTGYWWAAVLIATVCVNVYVGAYDAVLVVIAGVLTFAELRRRPEFADLLRPFAVLVSLTWLVAWITQPIGRTTGFQPITVVLVAFLGFVLYCCAFARRAPSQTAVKQIVP